MFDDEKNRIVSRRALRRLSDANLLSCVHRFKIARRKIANFHSKIANGNNQTRPVLGYFKSKLVTI